MNEATARRPVPLPGTVIAALRAARARFDARRTHDTNRSPLRPVAAGAEDLFADIADITAWLDACNPDDGHEDSMRVLKLVEEAGEAAAAYIGMVGQNPRKGVTHSLNDLLGELADVAVTALCAMQHFTHDQAATRAVLAAKVQRIMQRAGIPRRPGAADADQGWFWAPTWLAGEREATAQIAAGNLPVYDDMAALFADADADPQDGAHGAGGPQDVVDPYADDFPFGPPRQPLALGELHALARRVRARTAADRIDAQVAERAAMLDDAQTWAQVAFEEDFQHHENRGCGEPPAPPLVFKGYADRAADGTWRLCAVAHLGQGVFLAHHRAPHPAGAPDGWCDRFEVIAACACAPNRYRQDQVSGLADLADVLDQILTAAPVCAGTCAASSIGDPDARPGPVAGSEDAA